MQTIRDVAKKYGVSYEAIRQQIARNRDKLSGHIFKEGKTQYLDDEAVRILGISRTEPVNIIPRDDAVDEFRTKYFESLQEIHDKDQKIQELLAAVADTKVLLAETNGKMMLLETASTDREERISKKDAEIEELKRQLEEEKKRHITFKEWIARL